MTSIPNRKQVNVGQIKLKGTLKRNSVKMWPPSSVDIWLLL